MLTCYFLILAETFNCKHVIGISLRFFFTYIHTRTQSNATNIHGDAKKMDSRLFAKNNTVRLRTVRYLD